MCRIIIFEFGINLHLANYTKEYLWSNFEALLDTVNLLKERNKKIFFGVELYLATRVNIISSLDHKRLLRANWISGLLRANWIVKRKRFLAVSSHSVFFSPMNEHPSQTSSGSWKKCWNLELLFNQIKNWFNLNSLISFVNWTLFIITFNVW